jgi:hypothetical protein
MTKRAWSNVEPIETPRPMTPACILKQHQAVDRCLRTTSQGSAELIFDDIGRGDSPENTYIAANHVQLLISQLQTCKRERVSNIASLPAFLP